MSITVRIAKNTIFLYIRLLITMGVSLYTSRVILSTLGVEDFGTYNVVGGLVAMVTFFNSALATGTQRFLTFQLGKNDLIELKKTFAVALNIHIILAGIILILAETLGLWFFKTKINVPAGREYAAMWVYQFSVFTVMLSIVQVPYNASIIAHERMSIYAYVSIIDALLKLIIVYILSVSNYDKLITYAVLIFVVNSIVMNIYLIYCKKQYAECRFVWGKDRALYKSMLVFSGWNILGCGAFAGSTQGVNILLNLFFGTLVNAARGIAVQVSNALASFVNNFQAAVNPQIVKSYALGKIDDLHTLLFQNAKFSFCLMWLLLLPVMLKTEVILELWLVEVPEYTALFCRLILLQALISCVQRPFVTAIHAIGRMKVFSLTAGIALLSVLPISYFFLKVGASPYIPFVVYIIGTIIEFVCELFLLHKWIDLPIRNLLQYVFVPQILIVICSLSVSWGIDLLASNTIITVLISGLSVCVSVYCIAFSKSLRIKTIRKVFQYVRNS